MFKKLFCFSCILLILGITSTSMADADLVAYYGMEEGSGNTVADGSLNGYHGTTNGSPTWVDGPDGFGTALRFAGATSGVECGTFDPAVDGKVSIACWAYFELGGGTYQGFICKNGPGQTFMTEIGGASGTIYWNSGGTDDWNLVTLTPGVWTHVAFVHDNASATTAVYANGVLQKTSSATWVGNSPNAAVRFGATGAGYNFFNGVIDEVYFFSSLLTADEVVDVMNGKYGSNASAGLAKKPNPINKSEEVSIDVGGLSWTPGDFVAANGGTHNVFFGTDVNSVTNATIGEPLGTTVYQGLVRDNNSIDLDRLEYGKTYYWRVDEVNIPSKPGTAVGKVWEFTTEPEGYELAVTNIKGVQFNSPTEVYDYQDPNSTYNGKGLLADGSHSNQNTDANSTMWVGMGDGPGDVWLQYELDKVYKLHQLKIWNYNEPEPSLGFGAKDVNVLYSIDNVTWKALDEIQVFPMATGETTYKADIFVNMNGAIAKYVKLSFLSSHTEDMYTGGISEIRFLVIPTRASAPSPANNATNVNMSSILSWKAGRDAAVHKIYIDTDSNSVRDGISGIKAETADPTYEFTLTLSKTYYWKVEEVNDAEEYVTWDGPIWRFSTAQSILIDGFETGYDNAENAVYKIWKDSGELGNSSVNGSWTGRKSEPYLHTINHSGGHSAPMSFDNSSVSSSYVIAQSTDLPIGTQDWSLGSPSTLTIWFRGDPNGPVVADSELYCIIGGKTATYGGSVKDALQRSTWYQWDIDLNALGADLSNIPDITIGIKKVGATGAIGVIYLDDIQLTGVEPQPIYPAYYVEAENADSITTGMSIQTTTAGYTGTGYIASDPEITANQTANPPTAGIATYTFNIPETGQYRIGFRTLVKTEGTTNYNSWWIKFSAPSSTGFTDWANFNEVPAGSWLWRDVWNGTGPTGLTYVISQPGTFTLQVAYRERGMMLDAIEIRKIGN